MHYTPFVSSMTYRFHLTQFLCLICLFKIHMRPITAAVLGQPTQSWEVNTCLSVCLAAVSLSAVRFPNMKCLLMFCTNKVLSCNHSNLLLLSPFCVFASFCQDMLLQIKANEACKRALVSAGGKSGEGSGRSVKQRKLLSQHCCRLPGGDHLVACLVICTAAPKTQEQRTKLLAQTQKNFKNTLMP